MVSRFTIRRAHTLVEALIVIAILIILAALIYANMGPAKEKARRSVCLSNLSQLNHAITMYRAGYDGADTGATPTQCAFPNSPWLLLPYTGQNEGVFHCPSATRARA